ncbi:hypothetical protein YYG_01642 [Plasmodium vinckei petteri]|uniref:PIR protein CIR protein n=1 Tax=Plasmodium vinckei petteri TaxID=138298 RepID=W7B6K7_PLAVN|nr:hypothetical protein YYG_01642 [Plasmodium vinckei petteri]
MDDKTCDLLNEVDEYFNNRGVNVVKFNKNISLKNKCPYDETSKEYKCTTNNDRVNALSAYLYEKISEINKTYKEKYGVSKHIEVFMIWLGDKLFKIDNDYKITLEESYKNNLENSMGNVNYWKAIDSQKIYKKATIKKMSDYYSLLNYICKLINEYNKNPQSPNRSRLGNYSTQCDNFYKTIHKSINGCKPYLQLLDSLKTIFEIFRIYKIVNNYNIKEPDKTLLLNRVKSLTTFQNENRYFVTVNAALSFDDKECLVVKSNDEQIGEKIASQKPKNPVRGTQARVPGNAQHGNTGTRKPASPHPKRPPTQPTTLKQPSGKLKLPPPSPAKPVAVKPAPPPPPPPQSLPSTPSQTGNELKTPQAGKPHQNEPGGTVNGAGGGKGNTGSGVNGGGSVQGNQGSISGASGDGSRGSSKTQTGSDIGTGSLGGEPGGAAGGKGGSNNNLGVKNSVSDASGGGTSSGASGGQDGRKVGSNDVAGGKVDGKGGTSGEKGGKSSGSVVAQGDQGGSSGGSDDGSGGTGSGPGGQTKLSRNLPQGNPVPAQSATAPSETGTPQSAGTIPPTSASTSSPQDPATLPQPQPQPDPKPQQTQQVQQPTLPIPAPPQNDPASQIPQTGGSSDKNEPKDSDNSKGYKNGASDNTGGSSSGSKDPGGGPSDLASNTSGGSFNLLSPFLGFIFNGTNKFNQASQFIEKNRQNFENAKNKISDAYNNTVDNLKNAYNASSDYLNNFINNVNSQLNQVGSPSKSDGNQDGSGSPTGGGNPSTPPIDPQPPSPQITPPDPVPTAPPTTPIDPTLQKQSSPQPQYIIPHPPQLGPFIQKTPGKAISQLVKSLSSNPSLKKTWNIFPTTWNGSGDCKPEIKFINTTLLCCTSEQCKLTKYKKFNKLSECICIDNYNKSAFIDLFKFINSSINMVSVLIVILNHRKDAQNIL